MTRRALLFRSTLAGEGRGLLCRTAFRRPQDERPVAVNGGAKRLASGASPEFKRQVGYQASPTCAFLLPTATTA